MLEAQNNPPEILLRVISPFVEAMSFSKFFFLNTGMFLVIFVVFTVRLLAKPYTKLAYAFTKEARQDILCRYCR